jgi:Zn-dependent protease with chaperone function
MKYTPRLPKSNVNVTSTSPLREFFVLTLSLFGIVIAIYILLGFAVDLIVPRISTDLETKMSELFIRSVDAEDIDPKWGGYVQSLVEDLEKRCTKLSYPFKVHVRKSPSVNALAFPGGHIIVFTGLLEKVTSENELAFVFAHEMGHYVNRDHLRGVGRAFVFITISTFLFGTDSNVSQMLAHALNITELSFSRKQETRADEYALDVLNCAYGNVAGATDFFKRIPEEQDPGKFGHYFASHPENLKRINHLNKIIRGKGFKLAEKKPLLKIIGQLKNKKEIQ